MPLSPKDARIWARGSCATREFVSDKDRSECIETNEDGSRFKLVATGRKYRGNLSTTTEFKVVERLANVEPQKGLSRHA
jgi:hypothetical protein